MKNIPFRALALATTAFACLATAPSARAAEPFGPGVGTISANVGVVSDYRFRGISQSNEEPAIQGGVDYTHDSGVYLGLWGSSVEFGDASAEVDLYGGWGGSFNSVDVKFGGIYYAYPGTDNENDYDYFELAGSVGHDFGPFALTGGLNWSPDYFGSSDTFWYPYAKVSVPLPADFKLTGSVGYNSIDEEAVFGASDYWDWSAGVGYNFYGFDLSLQYVGTSIDEGDPDDICVDGCSDVVVFGVTKAF